MSRKVEVTEPLSVRASDTTRDTYGPGVHEVPDEVAEDLLQHRAVREPDQSDGAEADPEAEDWDATEFVDQHHATVTNAIQDGHVDDQLDAVVDAEEKRDSPRPTVLDAVEERREQVQG